MTEPKLRKDGEPVRPSLKADTALNDLEARAILSEARRRGIPLKEEHVELDLRFIRDLFQQELDLVKDPSTLKAALCSRRAGKSRTACAYLLKCAIERPNSLAVYIALTRKSAKRIMWRELIRYNQMYSLQIVFNSTELTATLPNGSTIILAAANNEAEIDRLRGSAYTLVVIDEAASFGDHIRELVDEVIEPALIDYNGTLMLIGTPGAAKFGMFYEVTTGQLPGWSNHAWTILDNPHIPHARKWLEEKRAQKQWTENHPIYRREWLGLWEDSDDGLVYKYKPERNSFDTLPDLPRDGQWHHGLGVDIGFDDPTTFCLGAFSYKASEFYVKNVKRKAGMLPSEIAETIIDYREKYDLMYVVIDQGGLGKAIAEEFRRRYHIPCIPAEKNRKHAFIDLCNGDLVSGRVKIANSGCQPLIDELRLLQWDPDRPDKEDERYENDAADAFLYCWREARHYLGEPDLPTPEKFSKEWYERQEKQMEADLTRALKARDRGDEDAPF